MVDYICLLLVEYHYRILIIREDTENYKPILI